jgi:hypothetical protein
MKAREMFKELGYAETPVDEKQPTKYDYMIQYIKKGYTWLEWLPYPKSDKESSSRIGDGDIIIIFMKDIPSYTVNKTVHDKRKSVMKSVTYSYRVGEKLHQAITQQMKELGWIE